MESRAQRSEVMVFTYTLELNALAVEIKAILVPLDAAHAKAGFMRIDFLLSGKENRI